MRAQKASPSFQLDEKLVTLTPYKVRVQNDCLNYSLSFFARIISVVIISTENGHTYWISIYSLLYPKQHHFFYWRARSRHRFIGFQFIVYQNFFPNWNTIIDIIFFHFELCIQYRQCSMIIKDSGISIFQYIFYFVVFPVWLFLIKGSSIMS